MTGHGRECADDCVHPDHRAPLLFECQLHTIEWRVERPTDDGAIEMASFSGPNARERAERFARSEYGGWRL